MPDLLGLSRWNDSLLVDLRLAGIVEAWAAGASWQQIMADSSMDDGDMARLLIRTTDLLRQVHLEFWCSNCRMAACDGFPC